MSFWTYLWNMTSFLLMKNRKFSLKYFHNSSKTPIFSIFSLYAQFATSYCEPFPILRASICYYIIKLLFCVVLYWSVVNLSSISFVKFLTFFRSPNKIGAFGISLSVPPPFPPSFTPLPVTHPEQKWPPEAKRWACTGSCSAWRADCRRRWEEVVVVGKD